MQAVETRGSKTGSKSPSSTFKAGILGLPKTSKIRKLGLVACAVCIVAAMFCLTACASQSESSNKESSNKAETSQSRGASSSATTSAAYTIQNSDNLTGTVYTATGADESALFADGVTASINGVTVDKPSGDATSADGSSFYGINAAVRAIGGAHLNITNSLIKADAKNATGIFAYSGATIDISDSTVNVTGGGAGGIQVAGGGVLNATNLDVTSASKAAIRSDRGGGTLTVNGGNYTATGESGCPAVYSTADISVKDATLTSTQSKAIIIEGKNSVALNDCNTTGNDQSSSKDSAHANVLLYQSTSGDASVGTCEFTAEGGALSCQSGAQFLVTNTSAVIDLKGVELSNSSDESLMIAAASRWGKDGRNGGTCTLNATDQTLSGSILVDSVSSLNLNLISSNYTGAIDKDGANGTVNVVLDSAST